MLQTTAQIFSGLVRAVSTAAMMFIKLYYGDTFICLVKLLMLAMKLFVLFDFSFSHYYNHEVAFH